MKDVCSHYAMNISDIRAPAYPQIQFIITLIIISFSSGFDSAKKIVSDYFIMGKQVKKIAEELGISTRQVSRDKNSALAKMLKRMEAAGYESYAEAAGVFLQESDYIPTQMETQNSIMKKRTGEVRLPSDNKAKK